MGPVAALTSFFKRYFDVVGRSRRSEYGWLLIIMPAIYIGGAMLLAALGYTSEDVSPTLPDGSSNELPWLVTLIYGLLTVLILGTIIPWTTLTIRRFHDMGRSGWWHALFTVLWIIPPLGALGWIVQFFWVLFGGGTAGANAYGPDPRFSASQTFG
ncbi:MAG: DUF805 domain-containing protein [Pseudomonadota bacterium]